MKTRNYAFDGGEMKSENLESKQKGEFAEISAKIKKCFLDDENFEFPRQTDDDGSAEPDVMQFKASQKLVDPKPVTPITKNTKVHTPRGRLTEEGPPSLMVKEKHLDQWHEIAYQVFSVLTDTKSEKNVIVCVPQIIATLEVFAQAAAVNCRKFIRNLLFSDNSMVAAIGKGNLSAYLREWEDNAHLSASPGCFVTQRRLLIHPHFSKSYSLETMSTLTSLGTESKICPYEKAAFDLELNEWLRKNCQMENLKDEFPIKTWARKVEGKDNEKRDHKEINNWKCPIFVAASHFEFPIKTNALDNEFLYETHFGPKNVKVVAFRIICSSLQPFKYVKISDKSQIIELPSACDNLSLYIIDNCDDIDIKKGRELKQIILGMDKAKINSEYRSLYVPTFFEIGRSTNIAKAFSSTLPNLDRLFQPDSFGDLSYEGGEPSVNEKTASSIQHCNHIELMKHSNPEAAKIGKIADEIYHVIDAPFMFIVWDNTRKIPIYIIRIASPTLPNITDGPNKKVPVVSKPQQQSWFKFWKKKSEPKKPNHDTIDVNFTQSQLLDP